MKRIYLLITTLFTVVLLIFSCKKESNKCEKWLVQDKCYPKTAAAHCFYYDPKERDVCGEQLDYANQGKEWERSNSADARLTTIFIHKVQ